MKTLNGMNRRILAPALTTGLVALLISLVWQPDLRPGHKMERGQRRVDTPDRAKAPVASARPVSAAVQSAPHPSPATMSMVPVSAAVPFSEAAEFREQRLFGSGWSRASDPVLARFREWTGRYVGAGPEAQAALLPEGVRLARERRPVMEALIQKDPQAALQVTVPEWVRRQLPPAVVGELEVRLSGRGDYEVLAVTPPPDGPASGPVMFSYARLGNERYVAHVYGRRQNQRTRHGVSLHGVAMGREMALSDSPLRILEAGEPGPAGQPAEPVCSVSGAPAAEAEPRVASGDRIHYVCAGGHLQALEQQVMAAEGDAGTVNPMALSEPYASTGPRRLLAMLVDFPDRPGAVASRATAQATLNEVTAFLRSNSFQRLTFTAAEVTPVLRLPQVSSYYATAGHQALMDHARAAATSAGYNLNSYDFEVLAFANIGFFWSGLGYVAYKGAWVQGSFDGGVIAHELAHNIGNWHANAWRSPSIIGSEEDPSWRHLEYGNPFDVLGNAWHFPSNQHNANLKFLAGWLPLESLWTVSFSGTYRIHAHDTGGSLVAGRRYAIRIPAAISVTAVVNGRSVVDQEDYWVEFRQGFRDGKGTADGVLLHWGNDGSPLGNRLLDANPATYGDWSDAALPLGRVFQDSARSLRITPVARGGSGADAYVDVRVETALQEPVFLGRYSFSELTGRQALDSSGNGRHGTLLNGPTRTNGIVGRALRFDGVNDRVGFSNASALNVSGPFTVACWVKPESVSGTRYLVIKGNEAYDHFAYALIAANARLQYSWMSPARTRTTFTTTTNVLAVGRWTHVAVAHTPGRAPVFYTNGVVVPGSRSGGSSTNLVARSANPFSIGASADDQGFFRGSLDEVFVCAEALTSAGIRRLTNGLASTTPLLAQGPVASPSVVADPVRLRLEREAGMGVLRWNGVAGRHYRVQYRDGVAGGGWEDYAEPIRCEGTEGWLHLPLGGEGLRLFRVQAAE